MNGGQDDGEKDEQLSTELITLCPRFLKYKWLKKFYSQIWKEQSILSKDQAIEIWECKNCLHIKDYLNWFLKFHTNRGFSKAIVSYLRWELSISLPKNCTK